ncbi:MAG: restriction endonuclease subunit S [Acidobacteria bacterium]|nr:restriction endonuclease subunit S [Acidobacteriota bacterium]
MWFLDRGKRAARGDTVLFVDARNVYRQLDRAHRDFTPQQIEFLANIVRLYPYYGAAKIFDYVNDYIFDGDYLLIAEDGSVVTPEGFPVLQLVRGKFWANNHTHILQAMPPLSLAHLYLALSRYPISGHITGAAQPKITQGNLNRIKLTVAPEPLLNDFNKHAVPMLDQRFILESMNANLRTQRNALLPKLISGEIDAADLDAEPAASVAA